jgi:hypothetical protein
MVPIYIYVLSTGDIWVGANKDFTPAGTILATYRVNSLASPQKIGTLSGNSGSYACSGGVTNKHDSAQEKH